MGLSGLPQVLLDLMRFLLGLVQLKGVVLEDILPAVLLEGVVRVFLLETVLLIVLR